MVSYIFPHGRTYARNSCGHPAIDEYFIGLIDVGLERGGSGSKAHANVITGTDSPVA
jgi:hypothetical protein